LKRYNQIEEQLTRSRKIFKNIFLSSSFPSKFVFTKKDVVKFFVEKYENKIKSLIISSAGHVQHGGRCPTL